MYERPACVVHVYRVSAHRSAAYAYRKRRGGSPCHRRLREVPFGCVPGHRVRVERRARVLAGRISFVSIHTQSVVAREPRGTRVGSTFTMFSITLIGYPHRCGYSREGVKITGSPWTGPGDPGGALSGRRAHGRFRWPPTVRPGVGNGLICARRARVLGILTPKRSRVFRPPVHRNRPCARRPLRAPPGSPGPAQGLPVILRVKGRSYSAG